MLRLPVETVAQLRPFYEGRCVCVTGGAGFIGGHLLDALTSLGARVSVLDDLSTGSAEHLGELIDLDPDSVRFVHASLLDDEAVSDAFDGAQTVFHLAALGSVPRSVEDPERTWIVNATGTMRVLEAARRGDVERVVYASSSSAYGGVNDEDELPLSEDRPPAPASPYAASKLAGEHLSAAWSASFGLDTACLRYFNVFGPRQRVDTGYAALVPLAASALLNERHPVVHGDGRQSRDFTFVTNAVLATLLAGSSPHRLNGRPINVAAGARTSVLELLDRLAELSGFTSAVVEHREPRKGDVRHSQADIALAERLIGYRPLVDLDAGIRETVAWYRGVTTSGSERA